jgi:hypothetical protein
MQTYFLPAISIGHPGTGILLKDTFIMCSQASAGINDTENLQKNNYFKNFIKSVIAKNCKSERKSYLALP